MQVLEIITYVFVILACITYMVAKVLETKDKKK